MTKKSSEYITGQPTEYVPAEGCPVAFDFRNVPAQGFGTVTWIADRASVFRGPVYMHGPARFFELVELVNSDCIEAERIPLTLFKVSWTAAGKCAVDRGALVRLTVCNVSDKPASVLVAFSRLVILPTWTDRDGTKWSGLQ